MKPATLLALLQDFHRDKLALLRRHEAGAQKIGAYEFNNTYQYVLAREAAHVQWLRAAIEDLGAAPEEPSSALELPAGGKGDQAALAIIQDDGRRAQEFIRAWRTRVETVSQARHRKMLELVLGEVAEHQRFFEQAAAGQRGLLGRRPEGVGTGGGVMADRWIE